MYDSLEVSVSAAYSQASSCWSSPDISATHLGVAKELFGLVVLRDIFLQLFDDGFGGAEMAGGVLVVQQKPVFDGWHRVAQQD